MDFLFDFLGDENLATIVLEIARIVVPILVTFLLGLLVQSMRWVNAWAKLNLDEKTLTVVEQLVKIAVASAEEFLRENKIPMPWDDEETTNEALVNHAIPEFELLRTTRRVPPVASSDLRMLINREVADRRNVA